MYIILCIYIYVYIYTHTCTYTYIYIYRYGCDIFLSSVAPRTRQVLSRLLDGSELTELIEVL